MRKINTQLITRGIASVSVATAILMFGAAHAQKKDPMPQAQPPASTGAPAAAPAGGASNEALFKRIDTDADGSISKAELEKFDPEASKSFDKYDADKDGKLSMGEFDTMVKGLKS
jgi:EF hand